MGVGNDLMPHLLCKGVHGIGAAIVGVEDKGVIILEMKLISLTPVALRVKVHLKGIQKGSKLGDSGRSTLSAGSTP